VGGLEYGLEPEVPVPDFLKLYLPVFDLFLVVVLVVEENARLLYGEASTTMIVIRRVKMLTRAERILADT